MKLKASTGRKLRYGSTSVALTALIIAIIIALNFIVTLVIQRYALYIDLTPDYHFTISDECYELIGGEGDDGVDTPIEMIEKFRAENKEFNTANGYTSDSSEYRDENVMINILFCLERDTLLASSTSEYVVRNAEELQAKYPDHISVEFVNSRRNPSRVSKYLSSNTDTIGVESVIIECGSEYRVRSIESFYINKDGQPFGYNGEKAYTSSILAVTRAEVPLACYTTNHGEAFPTSDVLDASGNPIIPFLQTMEDAGYRTQGIDLAKEEIPENCRVLIVFDPKQDFLAGNDGTTEISELEKLDDYLADKNSLMVFMSPDTYDGEGGFENLEEFLGDWGLAFRRDGADPYIVRDSSESILGNTSAVVGTYAENPVAIGWTQGMTSDTSKPKVVIPNAVALTYAKGYDRRTTHDTQNEDLVYTVGYNPTMGRTVYDLFVGSETSKAYAADREIAASSKTDPLKLMAVSVETSLEQEWTTAIETSAYVMLCGSTEFAESDYLNSNAYGNTDFLMSALRLSGREPIPVGLKYKEFANYTIDTITTQEATQYTVILTLVPVVVALFAGVFVIVRRKNR